MEFTPDQQRILLDYARAVIRQTLRASSSDVFEVDDPAFTRAAGCFVTLHRLRDHRLRGCIGQMQATDPLIESVREMSQAVLRDPRFSDYPVSADELPELEIEITILSPLEPAKSTTDFDLLQHGIYLHCSGRSGCFLPQVARETGWTKEQLLTRLCTEKMGLPADSWQRPEAKLSRFTATIIGPEPFEKTA